MVGARRVATDADGKEIAPSFKGSFWLVLDVPDSQLIPVSRRRTAEVRQSLGLSWSHRETPADPSSTYSEKDFA